MIIIAYRALFLKVLFYLFSETGKKKSDYQLLADIRFQLLALHQIFGAHKNDKRAVGRTEHTVDLVDADVAVLRRLSDSRGYFQMNWYFFDIIHSASSSM